MARLAAAAAGRELDTAGDRAAVLDWRLEDPNPATTIAAAAGAAPLPWLPAIPTALPNDHAWGIYLTARADLVTDLAAQVHDRAHTTARRRGPGTGRARPAPDLLADVAVWRAATGVPDTDHRPTGPRQLVKALALWQRNLDARLSGAAPPPWPSGGPCSTRSRPPSDGDEFTPVLAERLAAVSRAGLDAHAPAAGSGRGRRPARRPRSRRAVVADQPPPLPRRRHQRRRPARPDPHLDDRTRHGTRARSCRAAAGQPVVAVAGHRRRARPRPRAPP